MKRMQLILVVGVCLLALPVLAQEQPPPPPQSEGQHTQPGAGGMAGVQERVKMLTDKLNLSVDQIAKIKPILSDQLAQMQAVRKDSSLTAGQRLDKIRGIHDETHAKIRDVLTDAQKKQFDAMQTEMNRHMRRNPPGGDENPPK